MLRRDGGTGSLIFGDMLILKGGVNGGVWRRGSVYLLGRDGTDVNTQQHEFAVK